MFRLLIRRHMKANTPLLSVVSSPFSAVCLEEFLWRVRCCRHPSHPPIRPSIHASVHPRCPRSWPCGWLSSSGAAVPVRQQHERCLRKMNFLNHFLSPSLFISPWSLCWVFASEIPHSLWSPPPSLSPLLFLSFFHFSCFLYSPFTYFSLYYLSCPPLHSFNPSRARAYKLTPSQPVM